MISFPSGANRKKYSISDKNEARKAFFSMNYEIAGVLGLPPENYTARELCLMHRRKMREQWNQTAAIMAMIHNCAFGVRQSLSPDELNPYSERKKRRSVSSEFVKMLFKKL